MDIREVLESYKAGRIDATEAERFLRVDYIESIGNDVNMDLGREIRKGTPEVVYARAKTPETVERILRSGRRLLVSGATEGHFEAAEGIEGVELYRECGCIVVGGFPEEKYGPVAVITAGTSDIPVAKEAVLMARMMGCSCIEHFDIGVSGLHRLIFPMKDVILKNVAAVVAVAGMEGALPTLISSLSPVPVVGVPTSTGYGMGGDGIAALMGMLQSCSPGLSVVNIDNGIGAGAVAAMIARGRVSEI
ncbi:MAG: nickel pincer cofactor biosynthesis protein LarB [Candidatus Methanomethylophilaceae archaeon]|nr:pyridinium-3,5-biscarboxylic acid mononucleotide synthase [Candidatus Methanomethylophilaceae archaeon]